LALLTVLFCVRLDLLIGLIIACTNRFAGHITRVVVERPLRVLARFLLVRSAVVMGHVISFLSFVTTVSNGAWFLGACSWYQFGTNLRRERQLEGQGEGCWRLQGASTFDRRGSDMRPSVIAKVLRLAARRFVGC
jgi:hypothetical protein